MPFEIPTNTFFPIEIPDASPTMDGLMSAADKAKLDSLVPGGNTLAKTYDNGTMPADSILTLTDANGPFVLDGTGLSGGPSFEVQLKSGSLKLDEDVLAYTRNDVGIATNSYGVDIVNTTVATGLNAQYSPYLRLGGHAWFFIASKPIDFYLQTRTTTLNSGTFAITAAVGGVLNATPSLSIPTSGGYITIGGVDLRVSGAVLNQVLAFDGTRFVPTTISSGGFYQTVQDDGVPFTQRAALNFTTGLVVTDDGIGGRTNIALEDTPVVPGSYTNASITVDQQGRITSAANGTSGIGGSITNLRVAFGAGPNIIQGSNNFQYTGATAILARAPIGTSYLPALQIENLGNSTVSNQVQRSPGLRFRGTAWNGTSSVTDDMWFIAQPVAGGATRIEMILAQDIGSSGSPTEVFFFGNDADGNTIKTSSTSATSLVLNGRRNDTSAAAILFLADNGVTNWGGTTTFDFQAYSGGGARQGALRIGAATALNGSYISLFNSAGGVAGSLQGAIGQIITTATIRANVANALNLGSSTEEFATVYARSAINPADAVFTLQGHRANGATNITFRLNSFINITTNGHVHTSFQNNNGVEFAALKRANSTWQFDMGATGDVRASHFLLSGNQPTVTAIGIPGWNSATNGTWSIVAGSNDESGILQLVGGTGLTGVSWFAANNDAVTVTLNRAYPNGFEVLIGPANQAAAVLMNQFNINQSFAGIMRSTSTWAFHTAVSSSGLTNGTTYQFAYHIRGR